MTMKKIYVINCNGAHCGVLFLGWRPDAVKAGWTCDSPRGLDFCPREVCQKQAPTLKPRGTCAFCGKRKSLRKNGCPTQHLMLDEATGVKIRCPGSYQVAKRG